MSNKKEDPQEIVQANIYLPRWLKKNIMGYAKAQDRSFSNFVMLLLRTACGVPPNPPDGGDKEDDED